MNVIRKLLGVAPIPTPDGAYEPSPLALKLATSSKTDYDGGVYSERIEGEQNRVLMVCTEERNMTMANGKKFSTGNHPVEMGLPMLHLLAAGFEIDIVTPTGSPVVIEEWAMPDEDADLLKLFRDYADAFKKPGSLAEFVASSMSDNGPYVAVYLPGGHGAMLGLPSNKDLGTLLRWADGQGLFTLAICHGPAALLAADNGGEFIYHGYKIAAFPDAVDKQTPLIGYMPGHMPWEFGRKLNSLGVEIINNKADTSCHVDRRLVSGASPKAANNFGRLAATTLLKALRS
ncbi:protein deglycase HchA [Aliiroseovarius sp. 2305UL8-7]|uniref:protein deglycase HchA n=1 Tax=Aliiroseovarius conchicola TaxID=3121637 RepID=UPI003527C24D